jgi:hypothetical protein
MQVADVLFLLEMPAGFMSSAHFHCERGGEHNSGSQEDCYCYVAESWTHETINVYQILIGLPLDE